MNSCHFSFLDSIFSRFGAEHGTNRGISGKLVIVFVITMTPRSDRQDRSDLQKFAEALSARIGESVQGRAFHFGGDEDNPSLTVILSGARQSIDVAMFAMRFRTWNVGIGVGQADLGTTIGTQTQQYVLTGPAMDASFRAVKDARKQGQLVPLRVMGAKPPRGQKPTEFLAHAQAVLQLIGHIVSKRSTAEWAVLDKLTPEATGQQREVAESLGMTVQAVSQAVKRSLFKSEHEVRKTAAMLLESAHEAILNYNSGN